MSLTSVKLFRYGKIGLKGGDVLWFTSVVPIPFSCLTSSKAATITVSLAVSQPSTYGNFSLKTDGALPEQISWQTWDQMI